MHSLKLQGCNVAGLIDNSKVLHKNKKRLSGNCPMVLPYIILWTEQHNTREQSSQAWNGSLLVYIRLNSSSSPTHFKSFHLYANKMKQWWTLQLPQSLMTSVFKAIVEVSMCRAVLFLFKRKRQGGKVLSGTPMQGQQQRGSETRVRKAGVQK